MMVVCGGLYEFGVLAQFAAFSLGAEETPARTPRGQERVLGRAKRGERCFEGST